jgi:uncharacterized protein YbjT (DUF2867 family)
MRIAVLGATGTTGTMVAKHLQTNGIDVVPLSRSVGVDAVTGAGLTDALAGVDAVSDTSNPFPPDDSLTVQQSFRRAAENLVAAAEQQRVGHLVLLSIVGIDDADFDDHAYYLAKRDQETPVRTGAVPWTILRTTQWFEYAENPATIIAADNHTVQVVDALIRPVAADSVAQRLVDIATGPPHRELVELTGPETMRLPALTAAVLRHRGERRTVSAGAARTPRSANGSMLPGDDVEVAGPTLQQWLAGETS